MTIDDPVASTNIFRSWLGSGGDGVFWRVRAASTTVLSIDTYELHKHVLGIKHMCKYIYVYIYIYIYI